MPSFTARVDIEATPEVVYEHVADLARHGDWSTDALAITPIEPDRFRSSTRAKGKAIEAELTVVERDPPSRFVFDAEDLTGRWRHTFTLEPIGSGTRVTRRASGALSGGQVLLYWLVVLPIKRPNAARALVRLKTLIESGA